MSSNYSANQYDSAFRSQRLQNWCETKHFKERPTAQRGHTTFIANDRGHLLPGVVKKGSAWPDFKGTWDLPTRIPAHCINPTSRSVEGLNRLRSWGIDPRGMMMQDDAKQTNGDVQQDSAALSAAVEGQPACQNFPGTASQNQDLQAAVVGSTDLPAEEKQAIQATGTDRPLSQCSAAEEKPASRPAAGEGTNSRPSTGKGTPASTVRKKPAKERDHVPSKAQQDC
uniref:protein Flattop n=1 Tax=Scatophagus argus TaxID=75038 RepID=UPI001ED7D881|nr:protein Flattop [Scatophagus argus]